MDAAFELQKLGDAANLEEAPVALERLEAELTVVRRELRRLVPAAAAKSERPAKRTMKGTRAAKARPAARTQR